MLLPKNIKETTFKRFLAECESAVGSQWVITGSQKDASYGRVRLPFQNDTHMPSAAVCPASLEELQAVVAIAQALSIPVWPVSTGRNLGYGASSVAERGTVVLDMRRMNRITDFDPELGTIVVEPGVSYQQLHDFLQASGYDYWIDFPGPGPIVSPLGNTLERGHGMTPYGDHFHNSCGYEILLADGTLFRTGFGGLQDSKIWQVNRHGFGPSLQGIFTQSNFGIVTKMGICLMPAPETSKTVLAVWPEESQLEAAINAIRPLRMDHTIGNEGVMGNAGIFLAGSVKRSDVYSGSGAVPQSAYDAAAKKGGFGAWNYSFSLYGRADKVASDWKAVKAHLEASGAMVIPDVKDPAQVGELSLRAFALFNWIPQGDGLTWFSPTAPAKGGDVRFQFDLARKILDKYSLDFMTGTAFAEREALNVMPIIYDRRVPGRIEEVQACFRELITAFTGAGYGLYRTGVGFMDQVAESHGELNLEVNRRIKRALDPKGIIAPGKSGVRV